MLKTKDVFIIFFSLLILFFGFIFYIFTNSHLHFLLLKQYEQKIQSLDDVLRFSLLKDLHTANIDEFARHTGADFIIYKDDFELSSIKNTSYFLSLEEDKIHSINSKRILIKSFFYEDYRYSIIVYPKFLNLENFWLKIVMSFSLYFIFVFILVFFIEKKLARSFKKILEFLNSIGSQKVVILEDSIFKELVLLNKKLLKTKEKILKNSQKNKKQSDKISLKNTQLRNIICAISHELKNPLSIIDLSLEMLRDKNLRDEKFKIELLEKISRQSFRLNALTHKLNFVFNLNNKALQMQEFDLFFLCEKITKNPGFERVRLEGKSTRVRADEFLIEQVIINLLSNALKYSQREVILSVEDKKIVVEDFGNGIEENELKFITKKFYKVNTKSNNSFGLGLFLVKKILSIHQSYLEISSVISKGSKFSFTLH